MLRCISCNTDIRAKDNFVSFRCPNCGKETIVRCETCKRLGNEYTCPNPDCKFTGP